MNISDLPEEFAEMQIPIKQAMEEAVFIRDSYIAEIEEYADAETVNKIKKGVEKRVIDRTLGKLDELSDFINDLNDDDPATDGVKASVTSLSDYLKDRQ